MQTQVQVINTTSLKGLIVKRFVSEDETGDATIGRIDDIDRNKRSVVIKIKFKTTETIRIPVKFWESEKVEDLGSAVIISGFKGHDYRIERTGVQTIGRVFTDKDLVICASSTGSGSLD